MSSLQDLKTKYPTWDEVALLEPEDLGIEIVRALQDERQVIHRTPRGLSEAIAELYGGTTEQKDIAMEAIAWTMSAALLITRPDTLNSPFIVLSRRGSALKSHDDVRAFRAIRATAYDLLPVEVREKAWGAVVKGDYDIAVAHAFKVVEVAMRQKADLPSSDFGNRLAKKFFARVEDTALQREDRKGDLSDEEHLFLGAFGLYRDRAVHELPHIDSADYALEVMLLAAHLLRIVQAATLIQ